MKYVLEVIAIVIGITLSFMVDEWRENREKHEASILLIRGIQEEMEYNKAQLQDAIEWYRRGREAGLIILSLYNEENPDISTDSLHVLVKLLEFNFTYDPIMGVLNSGISSGQINYIENVELRAQLGSFENLLFDANESTTEFGEIRNRDYYPLIGNYVSGKSVWRTEFPELPDTRFTTDIAGLLSDRQLESVLTYLTILKGQSLQESLGLQEDIERILKLISDELAN